MTSAPSLRSGGRIVAENIETGREVTFSVAQWLTHRNDVALYRAVLGRLQANPILQFGYGFAEGVEQQVQGILELFGNLRAALDGIAHALSRFSDTVRALANQLIEAIFRWGREFASSEIPQRARMAGRLLGSIVFEIVTEIPTGGVAAAIRGALVGLRGAQGLAGIFRIADRVGDATRVMGRVVSRSLSRAARAVLERHRLVVRQLRHRFMQTAFIVADGVLEVAGEFVRGTIRRVAEAGETIFVFVIEGAEALMVRLGRQLELPGDLAVWPTGGVCARP